MWLSCARERSGFLRAHQRITETYFESLLSPRVWPSGCSLGVAHAAWKLVKQRIPVCLSSRIGRIAVVAATLWIADGTPHSATLLGGHGASMIDSMVHEVTLCFLSDGILPSVDRVLSRPVTPVAVRNKRGLSSPYTLVLATSTEETARLESGSPCPRRDPSTIALVFLFSPSLLTRREAVEGSKKFVLGGDDLSGDS
eukprot:333830-Amphidinium_carterae.3